MTEAQRLQAAGMLGDEVVTGEAVALDLPAAGFLSRILGAIIDYAIFALAMLAVLSLIKPEKLTEPQYQALTVLVVALFSWLLPTFTTALTRGATLGKLATGTRLVRFDGGAVNFRQCLTRATVGLFEIWLTLGVVALLSAMISRRGQRLGDMAAGTYAVRWPKRRSWELDLQLPPQLATWAQTAQVRPMPSGLLLNIKDYLANLELLTAEAADGQGRILAAATESYVSPPPPWGTPAPDFLAAALIKVHEVEFSRRSRQYAQQQRAIAGANRLPYAVAERQQ
ncbi:MAG: RDD family protein [Trueperella sp.]|nr:RDD family protein [Trueperella sp.]